MAEERISQLGALGSVLFEDDLSQNRIKPEWKLQHGTTWRIENGHLKGSASSPEFQAKRSHHKGTTPSMSLVLPMKDVLIKMDFKISGGLNGAHFGFNDGTTKEGTGHVCRVILSTKSGSKLQKDYNSQMKGDKDETLLEDDWCMKSGTWYTIVFEVKGSEFAVEIVGGPKWKVEHSRINVLKSWLNLKTRGGNGEGVIEYDNIKVWELK